MTDFKERQPVWLYGFSTAAPMYTYLRMINYYRYTLELWDMDMVESFVDQNTFAFAMGNKLFAVLTNGNATQASFTLKNLPNGTFCSIDLHSDQNTICLEVSGTGTLQVEADPLGYPLIFVPKKDHIEYKLFTPYQQWSVEWVFGILTSILAPLVGILLYVCIQYLTPFCMTNRTTEVVNKLISEFVTMIKVNRNIEENDDIFSKQLGFTFDKIDETELMVKITEEEKEGSRPLSIVPPFLASHMGGNTPMGEYIKAYKNDPFLVWHMALEYNIPHLGFSNQLMFGGLGKVVEMFAEYATRPVAICAPMYDVFYDKSGNLQTTVLGDHWQEVTKLPLIIDGNVLEIQIFLLVPTLQNPNVFYFLLGCYELFGVRSRGKIYTFESERQQLLFFSAYNQTLGFLMSLFCVNATQFHDNHAGLSLAYINPAKKPSVLLTLHNGDYNTAFSLGTLERDKYIYEMLEIPLNTSNRMQCEQMGKFDFMNYVLHHINENQNGLGIVAVSPRYAQRCYEKFSRFWMIQKMKVVGILNGMRESERVIQIPNDLDAFLEKKKAAKQSLQRRLGLEETPKAKLIVFFGRVTHQKGCDLIGRAAPGILNFDPNAQLVMAGPVGDSYGSLSRDLMADVAIRFPGRAANLIGQYIEGNEKDELIMACDFFLCPSRFEPCGLADIEMGWMGAVMIGHGTGTMAIFTLNYLDCCFYSLCGSFLCLCAGGLQKMPGFYFEGKLDNKEDLAMRLEEVTKKALQESPEKIKAMSKDAIQKMFPPEDMVESYESVWKELNRVWMEKRGYQDVDKIEGMFFEKMWQFDNQTINDESIEPWNLIRAYWSNILLMLCQSFFRLPALIGLIWVDFVTSVGTIEEDTQDSSIPDTLEWFLIYLLITIAVAPAFQWLCWKLPPRIYICFACIANITAWLLVLWTFWAPSALIPLYIIILFLSNASVPFIGLIFIDSGGKVSVSEDGIKLYGISDVTLFAMLTIVYGIDVLQISPSRTDIEIAGIVFLVASVMVSLYLMSPSSLPPHFDHLRLRFRGQWLTLFKRRKAWYAFTASVFIDSFNRILILGALFRFIVDKTYLEWTYIALALSLVVAVACSVVLLTSRVGAKGSIDLIYTIAIIPYITVFQMLIIVYGPDWSALIAATVLQVFQVRSSLLGVLNLHTMPSRETTLSVTTIQLMIGSISIGIASLLCWKLGRNPWLWLTLCAITETLRLFIVTIFIKLHRQESLVRP